MDARGNKLSSCKIPEQNLKKKLLNFQNFGLKRKEKKRNKECCNTTLKTISADCRIGTVVAYVTTTYKCK